MKVELLTIGKCKDKAILSLCAEYTKRLKPFWQTEVTELADKSGDMGAEKALIEKHLAKQKPGAYGLVALDERGEKHSSRSFATLLKKFEAQGLQTLILLIGGADGIHPDIRQKADACLSLSDLTLPHMLVRPVILEQIYRAATILAGHPYHRD